MTEDDIQAAVIEHIERRKPPHTFAFAIPNGGKRHIATAVRLKRTGTKAGVPDLQIIQRGRPFFLELKKEGGRVAETQVRVMQDLQDAGATCGVAYGLNQALAWLVKHQLIRGE